MSFRSMFAGKNADHFIEGIVDIDSMLHPANRWKESLQETYRKPWDIDKKIAPRPRKIYLGTRRSQAVAVQ